MLIIVMVLAAVFAWLSYRQGVARFRVGLWTGRSQNVDREAAAQMLEKLAADDAFHANMLRLTTEMHLPTERVKMQYKLDPGFQQRVDLMIKHDMLITAATIAELVKRIKGGKGGTGSAEAGGDSGEDRRIIVA